MQQKYAEAAAHTSRTQPCRLHGWFPRQALVSDPPACQPELPPASREQPRPPIGRRRASGANRGPAQIVLAKAKPVLDREAASVPAPEVQQIGGQRPTNPRQPQRFRCAGMTWQALDGNTYEGEWRGGLGLIVEVVPHGHLDLTVLDVRRGD